MTYGEPKPPLGELAHHGVKGMKWGHRKAADIHAARERHNDRIDRLYTLTDKANHAESKARRAELVKKIHQVSKEGLNSEDLTLGARATTGEKVVVALMTGGIGNLLVRVHTKSQIRESTRVLNEFGNLKVSDFD